MHCHTVVINYQSCCNNIKQGTNNVAYNKMIFVGIYMRNKDDNIIGLSFILISVASLTNCSTLYFAFKEVDCT